MKRRAPLALSLWTMVGCRTLARRKGRRFPIRASWSRFIAGGVMLWLFGATISRGEAIDYARDVQPLLTKYCVGCHNADEAEGEFRCDTWDGLIQGTDKRRVIEAGSSQESFLVKQLLGKVEPKMPPEEEAQPTAAEIDTIRRWIDGGAIRGEANVPLRERLKVPALSPTHQAPAPISAIYAHQDEPWILVGRYNLLELIDRRTQQTIQRWDDVVGKVHSIRPSSDGSKWVVASGVAGIGGQISVLDWSTKTWSRQFEGHRDAIYAAVMSPDQRWIASGGYDRRIHLWNVETGSIELTLEGHNGPIYDLDFHPSGTLLASCSGDETSKIWQIPSGKRLDTLGQGEAEQYSIRFSPDGNRVFAAGADRRVRVWKLISRQREAINPMLYSLFAHEKAILVMRLSPDGRFLATAGEDRTIKLWSTRDMRPLGQLGTVTDTPSDIAWGGDSRELRVALLDGRVEAFDLRSAMARYQELARRASSTKTEEPLPTDSTSVSQAKPMPMAKLAERDPIHEKEPNGTPSSAESVAVPTVIAASFSAEEAGGSDEDWFSFEAKKGDAWVLTAEAEEKSAADTQLEIRHEDGSPVLRTRLQAVRESYFTFRGKDSSVSDDFRLHRWEDMELNEYLYSGGEVVKLWLYPRGPDSGFKVYPGAGKRQTYFDTTPIAHALGEPVWIVQELAPEETPFPNGLPVFPIYYENDDDATRTKDKDSRLVFQPPRDGRYLVRVRDARGESGENYRYRLTIRPKQADYRLTSPTKGLTVTPGTGGEFAVNIDRLDDFQGAVALTLEGVPNGVMVTQPLMIEAEQAMAIGTLFIPENATDLPEAFTMKLRGEAMIDGRKVSRPVRGTIEVKIATAETVTVRFVSANNVASDEIQELVIRPGETISTFIAVERGKEEGDIPFGKDDSGRNLPHGVYVDNIGLSGLVVKPGENTREVFITAAPWVKPQLRPFHLKSTLKGNPTTKPILLRVVE